MLTARLAVPGDAACLMALNEAFNGAGCAREDAIRASLADNDREIVAVAMADGQPVGFACAQALHSMCYEKPEGEITEMFVRSAHRRQGAGGLLIALLEQELYRRGARGIRLNTGGGNAPAQALYERCGYADAHDRVYEKRLER